MKNKTLRRELLISIIFFLIYLIATIYKSDFWGNLLSPVIGLIAFLILLKNSIKKSDKLVTKAGWLILALSIFNWVVTDVIWAVMDFTDSGNPYNNMIVLNLYTITNFFMALAVIIYGVYKFKKWNIIQLLLDAITISISTIYLFYILFLNEKMSNLILLRSDMISFITILFDIIIFVAIAIWFLSIRKGEIPAWMSIMFFGLFLFVVTDFVYYYLYYFKLYSPNSIIDAVYMAAFLILALGVSVRKNWNDGKYLRQLDYSTNIGNRRRAIYLLFLFPVAVLVFSKATISNLVHFLLIICIHLSFSFYIQLAVRNEELLQSEMETSIALDREVKKRTQELLEKNKKLSILANQDSVTNLYNRRYLFHILSKKMRQSDFKENIILLLVNLDRFKNMNGVYGHLISDQILIEMGKRLQEQLPEGAILAKLSGDEFAIALESDMGYSGAKELAETLIHKCSGLIKVEQYELQITMCIGISIFPVDAMDYNTLLKNADAARQQARSQGYNKYSFYDSKLSKKLNRKNYIEQMLRKADYDKEFRLFYQPQFSIPDNVMTGVEALLRWRTPDGEFISPAEFIPVAEDTGYIIPIGEWVIRQALKTIKSWNQTYSLNLKMGINVSIKQLNDENFMKNFKHEMNRFNVNAAWLDIEITESIAMEEEEKIIEMVNRIKEMKVSISIDDFGTGYSSLSYLKYLPVNRIKIAKELIDTIYKDNYDLQIVKAMNGLTKSMGVKMIAEGVELENQYDILVDIGCDEIQGYLLSEPLPETECEEMIARMKRIM